jgi:hypothetical protein
MSGIAAHVRSLSIASEAGRKRWLVWNSLATLIAITLIFALWLQNFGRVYLYDYSLISYANGYLHAGMRPYRDFGTPLQTLTYYLSYLSECVFGRRYLALGYSNLIVTYVLFGSVTVLLRRSLPYVGAVAAALTVCIATTLQHGILWYNALGVLLLVWVTFVSFDALQRQTLTWTHIAGFAILLFLTGTLKLNYHCAAGTVVGFCLIWLGIRRVFSSTRFVLTAAALALWAIVAPLCFELLTTGASFDVWKLNVLVRPSGRAHDLILMTSSDFWFGNGRGYYPADPFSGAFALGLLCYAAATFLVIRADRRSHRRDLQSVWLTICWIWMFFLLAVLLGVTNVDLGSAEATLPVGLLVACLLRRDSASRRSLQACGLALVLWIGWSGLHGIHRHSRLLVPTEVLNYKETYPVSTGYMKGALLAKLNAEQLADAGRIVEKYQLRPGSTEIYWGPGTEMFYRQFRGRPLSGFPLWYSPLTVRTQDANEVIARLQASPVRIFVADPFWYNIFVPEPMKAWLDQHWTRENEGSLLLFARPSRN